MKTTLRSRHSATLKFLPVICFLFLGLLPARSFSQKWAPQNSGITDKLSSVYFANADTGHAVSEISGKILRTVNGGLTWTLQTSPSASPVNESVFCIGPNTAYIAGRDFTGTCENNRIMVLKTSDAGANWNCVITGLPFNGFYLRGIHFPTLAAGFAVGDNGTIIATTNAGVTWTAQTQGNNFMLRSVYFTSASNGFAVGLDNFSGTGTVLKTVNGGTTWSSQPLSASQLNSVFFVSSTTGYTVGNLGVIYKTTNSGTTWSALNSGVNVNLNGIYFLNAATGYIAGDAGTILKTTDGGTTWLPLVSGTNQDLFSVNFPQAGTGYAVGANGTILKTCPAASFTANNTTVCESSTVSFTNNSVGAGNTYVWKSNNVQFANTTNASHQFNAAGTYTVTLFADNGTCLDSAQQVITVNAVPTVTLSPNTSYCAGGSAMLTAGGAVTYGWAPASGLSATTGNSVTASPAVTTTYTVTGTNASGCTAVNTVTVTVNPLPNVTYTQNPGMVCLNAVPFTLSAGSPGGGTYSGTGVSGNTFDPGSAGNGTWNVIYTYTDGNGCTNTAMQTITVDPCTGVQNIVQNNDMQVYPNPFENKITLALTGDHNISVYDVTGKCVAALGGLSGVKEIDLGFLEAGVYFIRSGNDSSQLVIRVVKQ